MQYRFFLEKHTRNRERCQWGTRDPFDRIIVVQSAAANTQWLKESIKQDQEDLVVEHELIDAED